MLKKLASLLIPSNAKLASQAANGIRNAVNGTADEKKIVIAKYATLANECSAIGQTLSDILKDGNVDNMEAEKLTLLIEPLIAKCREIVGV